ncbi:hypothetical protein CI102_3997 [Trichoderma harzianum]|nr:hypothetical protein CI102_3997 [Trichoderma harzianum]
MKFAISATILALASIVSAQWACDAGFQCGATIIHRDDSAFWVQNLKNAEAAVGRAGQDPLWDLFRCNSDRTVSFVQHCAGRCIYTGSPGRDRCEGYVHHYPSIVLSLNNLLGRL